MLLSLRSEWSQGFHIHVSYEVRPSPDVAVFVEALAVLSLGLLCLLHRQTAQDEEGRMEGHTRNAGCLFFF